MSNLTHETAFQTRSLYVNRFAQVGIFFALVAVALYAVLFTTYPAVHDYFHSLRHALMFIPCH